MGIGNVVIGNVHTLRFGLESGPVRRASTGVSPLLSLWLPSPEVAVKSPCRPEKKAFTSRTAMQPSLLLLLSIGKVILLCHHIGTQPARRTTSNALPEATFERRGQAIGPPHVSSECYPASGPQPAAKVRLEPPTRSRASKR